MSQQSRQAGFTLIVIDEFDFDRSGDVTVGELLSADILGIAQKLARTLSRSPGDPRSWSWRPRPSRSPR